MESKIRDGFFIGSKGQDTYFRIWTPSSTPIARVLAIHGLGEHIKRYDHVFKVFADNGILVRGMDWSGMGATVAKQLESKTSGAIKGYAEFETVYNDLEILNHFQVEENEKNVPTFCFGHSMVYFVDIGWLDNSWIYFEN